MPATIRRLPYVAAILVFAVSGCSNDKPTTHQAKKSTGSRAGSQRQTESPCEGALSTIDEVFNLSKLGRTTTISDGVLRLNDWQRTCAPAGLSSELPPDVAKLLSESQLTFLNEKRFLLRDGEHLRDCLLDRAVSGYAPGSGVTELEKVTHLFEHVVRAIGLVPTPLQNLPLTPYEVYLLGKGTAEDRAWMYINVLKQLRIDAILILPPAGGDQPAEETERPFLVGVLLDGQVYLFDPRAGVPVPAPAGDSTSGTMRRVATLAEAASDRALLKQLDAGEGKPYPISADDLKRPHVAIAADAAFWSPRMQGLQTQFVGARAMVIADPLADSGDGAPGVFTRIAKAGGEFWGAAAIHVWDVPEKRLVGHAQMTPEQQEILAGMLLPFGAFKNVVAGPNGQPVLVGQEAHEDRAGDKDLHPGVGIIVRTTAGAQMRARLDHLEGKFAQAVREYLEVRDKCRDVLRINFPFPLPDRIMHARAIEDATYWTALCQFEQGEFQSAINTLAHYRKRADSTNWQRESRYLLAVSNAAAGNFQAAIAELKAVEPDDVEYAGYRLLICQWQAAERSKAP